MILLAFGANLTSVHGEPITVLEKALELMPSLGISVRRRSSWYQTPAITPYAQPPYVNGVAVVEAALPPVDLLQMLHRIEAMFGRVRRVRWGERIIDIDLLDYDGLVVPPVGRRGADAGLGQLPLALPHPGIPDRGFVLVPLAEVAPEWRHPVTGQGPEELLQRLQAAQGIGALAGIEKITPQNRGSGA